ncbi:MAG: hypothetical protein ACKOW3_08565 [Hyphomicrobium sp.]
MLSFVVCGFLISLILLIGSFAITCSVLGNSNSSMDVPFARSPREDREKEVTTSTDRTSTGETFFTEPVGKVSSAL